MKFKLPRRQASSLLIDGILALGVVGGFWILKDNNKLLPDQPPELALSGKSSDRLHREMLPDAARRPSFTSRATEMTEVISLANDGHFSEAVKIARQISPDLRAAALASVFALWLDKDAPRAATSAMALSDSMERSAAWNAVITRWGETAPDQLAAFALSIEDKAAQQQAFANAIPRWLERDESNAITWVSALPHSLNCDPAVAMVARHEPLIERDPNLALKWAEAIQDPALRSRTLGDVIRLWLPAAPEEAAHFARTSPDISPSEREDILIGERFTAHP